MESCIFCKIAAGDLPSHKIYEDKDYLAFLDINPMSRGHTLVIPKKHYRWVWDVEEIGEYFAVVRLIVRKMQQSLESELVASMTIGEAVPHAHVHLLPNADEFVSNAVSIPKKEFSKEKMKEIASKIRLDS